MTAPDLPAAPAEPPATGRPLWRRPWAPALAAVALLAAAGIALLPGSDGGEDAAEPAARALADATPFDGRSPREPAAAGTRVLVELPRPPLGEAGLTEPADQRAYVRSLREESAALRSALSARGVRLTNVVTFERTWHGFAATVRTRDLADLDAFRARLWPVRRFYPATAEPARVPGTPPPRAAAPLGGVPVAVLDSGVDAEHPLLAGRLDPGRDAVDGDGDPAAAEDPRGGRRESSGTALAGVLAAAGERVLPIRIAGLQPAARGTGVEEVARSDQLLAGLENAVDPDGDGATGDRVTVALVGVNSPYAGFGDSPEASAIRTAAALGTLVIAPAGNEASADGPAGTVGSPGAAPGALTAGALAATGAARVDLRIGGEDAAGAALLAGPPPPDGLRTAGPLREADPARLVGAAGRALRGRIAVVEAGDAPVARAAAAAAAGARAVLVAEPRERRPLPAVPAGRIGVPVAGVTGEVAERVLDAEPGTVVEVGAARAGTLPGGQNASGAGDAPPPLSPFSSRGPTAAGVAKPDLAAPGAALTAVPGGGAAVVGGTGIAAAHTAVEAARLARARPDASPAQLKASLVAAAQAAGAPPVRGAGAGVLRTPPAGSYLTAGEPPGRLRDPCPGDRPCTRVVLANRSATDATVALALVADAGTSATVAPANLVIPAGGRREAEISAAAGAGGVASGRLEARSEGQVALVHPFALPTQPPAAPPLGPLELVRRKGRVTGVRFPVGAFRLGDPLTTGTTLALVARLDLSLVEPGERLPLERLTPATGARELLPAEYAYTLPAATARELGDALRAFRAVARSPAGGEPAVVESEAFSR